MPVSTRYATITQVLLIACIVISLRKSPITCDPLTGSPSRLTSAPNISTSDNADAAGLRRNSDEELEYQNKDAPPECEVFADYGKNYLTPIDVVVKNSESNIACIKARFALSIKVEELFTIMPHKSAANNTAPEQGNIAHRSILGYLPLENVLSVEDSCPTGQAMASTKKDSGKAANGEGSEPEGESAGASETKKGDADKDTPEEHEELEMIVTFGCGKLSFTFKRDKGRIFVSSIKGVVKLDKRVVREFVSVRPMFLTSDLDHHFKYDDIIEVTSEAQAKTYILTANFFFTEIEAFRSTTSRDFIRPPDESSKPFEDESTALVSTAPPKAVIADATAVKTTAIK